MRATASLLAAGAVVVSAMAAPAAARSQTAPVLPGYWESTDTVTLLGMTHERKCLTAEKIASFLAAPSNKHYQCTYASRTVEDGRATFRRGSCYSRSGRKVLSNVDVDGRYAPESFHLDFRFRLMVSAVVGMPANASIDAHRIAAQCPAPDPQSR